MRTSPPSGSGTDSPQSWSRTASTTMERPGVVGSIHVGWFLCRLPPLWRRPLPRSHSEMLATSSGLVVPLALRPQATLGWTTQRAAPRRRMLEDLRPGDVSSFRTAQLPGLAARRVEQSSENGVARRRVS
mmetsp:Transcript_88716/g.249874  ORF Transcript_88716/g.249874 Transcript_88716/m.249874 type:complete len:130 (-) Transcript_88716:16-405(-)